MQRKNISLFILIISFGANFLFARQKKPRLVIPIVIDQGSRVLLDKTLPFTSQGLYRISKSGLSHDQAYFPHACPNTSAGHAGLSTGVYPDTHGIIDNKYIDEKGLDHKSDEDNSEESFVFKKDGSLYEHGCSSIRLKSDTLLDQVMLESEPTDRWSCAAISIKSRAAVMLAGHQGEAFWFDGSTGSLTTSKAYASKMPAWVDQFNDQYGLSKNSSYVWKPFLSLESDAYKKWEINNYDYSAMKRLFKKNIKPQMEKDKPFDIFTKTPWGDEWTFRAAITYVKKTLKEDPDANILLWISLSSVDHAGHIYGPSSMELVDMIYHLDGTLLQFMDQIYDLVPEDEVLFVITADHGVFEIPEVLQDKGFSLPKRIMSKDIMKSMNSLIKKMHNLENFISSFDAPQFYFDADMYNRLSEKKQEAVTETAVNYLKKVPGIRNAWTPKELQEKNFSESSYAYRFKRQTYPGRNGHIMVLVDPYIMLTNYPTGTSHATPYWYDINVPLIWYQKGRWQGEKISEPVSTLRVAATLAHLMETKAPSAADKHILPGVIEKKDQM